MANVDALRLAPDALRHAGIILAAGASARMGRPKALLDTPAGIPLALYQVRLLEQAGCQPVVIVLGSEGETIRKKLKASKIVLNADWETGGRFSSVQAGLRAVDHCTGYFILPVDTVGVRIRTFQLVREYAEENLPPAIRPTSHGRPGQLAWISDRFKRVLLEKQSGPEIRLDHYLEKVAEELIVNDPAILRNVNTPEEWEIARQILRGC